MIWIKIPDTNREYQLRFGRFDIREINLKDPPAGSIWSDTVGDYARNLMPPDKVSEIIAFAQNLLRLMK